MQPVLQTSSEARWPGARKWFRQAFRRLGALALTVLLAGLICAWLTRQAPGFGVDERELDSRLGAESIQALRQAYTEERVSMARYYTGYLRRAMAGDFGVSHSLGRPVAELLAARAGVTARLMASGLAGGWLMGLALAIVVTAWRREAAQLFATLVSGFFLAVPVTAMAVLVFQRGGRISVVLALVLFPRIFQYARNLLQDASRMPHVFAARARGIAPARVLWRHVLPHSAPQLIALAGVSVSIALSAAIPLETVADIRGLGQLALHAALARDLPVLVALTLVVAVVAQVANTISEMTIAAVEREAR